VILNKTYIPFDRWNTRQTLYQWATNDNIPMSPKFAELTDALQWIKDHDESKETNQKTV
jgi:hypothetical protein